MQGPTSTYPFNCEFFDEDFTGKMSWSVLGKRILRAAAQHASDRSFEAVSINGRTYLWVLARMVIEMNHMPGPAEQGTITTWLHSTYRYFTDRYFTIADNTGQTYGQAATTWALIDSQTRRPVDLDSILGERIAPFVAPDLTLSIQKQTRIRTAGMQPVSQRHVNYSDLDKNGHLNSIRYIDYILDTFPKWVFESKSPQRIEISYSRESYYSDTVSILRKEAASHTYHFAAINNGKTACLCSVELN